MDDPLDLPLVLVEERDRADQGQVLQVIAPRARLVVDERQPLGVGVGDEERPEEPLGVLVALDQGPLVGLGEQPREGLPTPRPRA